MTKQEINKMVDQADQIIELQSLNDLKNHLSGLPKKVAVTQIQYNGFYSFTRSGKKVLMYLA